MRMQETIAMALAHSLSCRLALIDDEALVGVRERVESSFAALIVPAPSLLLLTTPSYASLPSLALTTRSSIVINNGTKTTSAPTTTAIGMENTTHKTVILMFEKRLEHQHKC